LLWRLVAPDNAAMETKRRSLQFSLRALFVVVTLCALLASCLAALGIGSPEFWSPFGGQLQFVIVLVAAIVLIGGGAFLTWLVAPSNESEQTSSHGEEDEGKSSSGGPASAP
jgi:hypothetical protein